MKKENLNKLKKTAKHMRQDIFRTICNAGGGHIPASLSIVEILAVLYNNVLKVNPKKADDPDRDRFILSKGHASVALYAILAEKGFFPKQELAKFGRKGSILGGHPDMHKVSGIEASTGSLGHGFPFGTGVALAGKLDKKEYNVFVIVGDGECQEGSIWEAGMFASQYKLDNLVVIVDYNKIQAMDRLEKIISLEPLIDKWRAFGWQVREVDGHDLAGLQEVFSGIPFVKGSPNLIIANTIKGKGVSFMENTPIWHYRLPNKDEIKIACKELEIKGFEEEL